MKLPEKEVVCECGHTNVMEKERDWCSKCANKICYNEKDQKWVKYNAIYIYGIIAVVLFLITFFFIEFIVVPISGS